jgi:hypothetical protein
MSVSGEQLLPHTLQNVPNCTLRFPILEVGVYPTEGEFLALSLAGLAEHAVCEAAVVAVVVLDLYAVFGGELLECSFRVNGLGQGEVTCHQVDKLEPGEVINKDCGIAVASFGECAFCLAIEPWLCQLHVINGDALPQLGGGKDRVIIITLVFGAPRNFGHGPKKAAGTAGRTNVGELGGDLAVARKLLELWEGGVAKAIMPSHQLSLIIRGGNRILVGFLKHWQWVERKGIPTKEVQVRGKLGRRR